MIFNWNAIPNLLCSVAIFSIGLFVYSQRRKSQIGFSYLLLTSSAAVWQLGTFFVLSSGTEQMALMYCRLTYLGSLFIPLTTFHFTIAVLDEDRQQRNLIIAAYLIGLLFFLPLSQTTWFISGVYSYPWGYWWKCGVGHMIFLGFLSVLMTASFYKLWRGLNTRKSQLARTRLWYVLLALMVAYLGAIDYLPNYGFKIYPFGYGFLFFYIVLTSYAIARYRLLDVELIVKKTLIFSGIFVMFMAVVSSVTAISQSFVGQYLKMGMKANGLMCSLLVALLYNPTHKLLINITDKYLFQKKENFKIILNRLAKNVISILDLHEVGETVLNTLQESLRLETGALIIRDEKNKHYGLLTAFNLNQVGRKFPSSSEFIRYFSDSEKSVNLEELDAAHMLPNEVVKNLEALKAVICVPLFAHGELIGLLAMGRKMSDQEFTQEEIDYLPAVASQTAIALRNAQLVDDVVQEREAKIRAQAIAKFVNYSKSIRHEIKNVVSKIYLPAEYLKVLDEFLGKLIKKTEEGFADKKKAEIVKKMIMEKKEPLTRYSNILILAGDQITLAANTASSAFSDDPNKFSIIYFRILWDAAKEEVNLEDCDCGANYADDFSVFGNLYLLQRVFVNLLNNSKDAMKDQKNKQITVNCSTRTLKGGQEVSWFEFQDNGPGIPTESADKIFDQDFSTKPKPDDADPQASGYGQGLYVCKTTIEDQHLGKIWVDREAKGGAKFIFWLPKKKSKE